ncbi:hypothetical protein SNEBB_001456 [Seison nebaliae]|nr:hypothetical protein SNEBB_001456 [Seison nebaliae]
MMDLHHYPLDTQNCTVEIESYGYTTEDLIMYWRNNRSAIIGLDKVQLPQFQIADYKIIIRRVVLATGDYERLSLSFKLKRRIGYFLFQTYVPSILVVMLSWVSFWINHEATSARVALGITTVLTMTTISTGVRSSLPRISYVKAIDIYQVMCFVFVFAALLEYATVNYTYWGARAKRKLKMRKKQQTQADPALPIGFNEGILKNTKRKAGNENKNEMIEMENKHKSNRYGFDINNNIPEEIDSLYNEREKDSDISEESVDIDRRQTRKRKRSDHHHHHHRHHHSRHRHKRQNYQKFKDTIVLQPISILNNLITQSKHRLKIRIHDVNKIDKYSRIAFPFLFTLFNISYWCYYLISEYQAKTNNEH